MKILGIDYGTKYIGLAIADEQIKIAHPCQVLENRGREFVLTELKKIIEKEKITKIVVGRPIGLSGNISEQTKITDEFINFLKNNLSISVENFDERFTSKMTSDTQIGADQDADKRRYISVNQRSNRRKSARRASARIDEHAGAAAIILQSYLDRMSKI